MGSALYSIGGFPLPFLSVGTFGLLVAIALYFVVPDVQGNANDSPDDSHKVSDPKGITNVLISIILFMQMLITIICNLLNRVQ